MINPLDSITDWERCGFHNRKDAVAFVMDWLLWAEPAAVLGVALLAAAWLPVRYAQAELDGEPGDGDQVPPS